MVLNSLRPSDAYICVNNLTTIGSVNGLSPGRRQAIIWTNAGILLIWPLGTNLSEILIEIPTFSFKKMRLKVSSAKWRSFCLGLNVFELRKPCVTCGAVYLSVLWRLEISRKFKIFVLKYHWKIIEIFQGLNVEPGHRIIFNLSPNSSVVRHPGFHYFCQ